MKKLSYGNLDFPSFKYFSRFTVSALYHIYIYIYIYTKQSPMRKQNGHYVIKILKQYLLKYQMINGSDLKIANLMPNIHKFQQKKRKKMAIEKQFYRKKVHQIISSLHKENFSRELLQLLSLLKILLDIGKINTEVSFFFKLHKT